MRDGEVRGSRQALTTDTSPNPKPFAAGALLNLNLVARQTRALPCRDIIIGGFQSWKIKSLFFLRLLLAGVRRLSVGGMNSFHIFE